jgi:hypothetical protein
VSFYVRCPSYTQVHQVSKGVDTSYDALLEFLESVENLLRPLEIYTQIPHTPVMNEIVASIMVEILYSLALATKELKRGRSSESVLPDVLSQLSAMQRSS